MQPAPLAPLPTPVIVLDAGAAAHCAANVSTAAGGYFAITPTRICDTRPPGPGVAANGCNAKGYGPLPPNTGYGFSGFNPIVTALVVNVTVTNTHAAGYMTVFDDSELGDIPVVVDVVGYYSIANAAMLPTVNDPTRSIVAPASVQRTAKP